MIIIKIIKAIINFLKPDFKKVLFFLILVMPFIANWLYWKGIVKIYFPNSFLAIIFWTIIFGTTLSFCGGMTCPRGGPELERMGFTIGVLIAIIIFWLLACILTAIWNKLFSVFKQRIKLSEKKALTIILILAFLIEIIFPVLGFCLMTVEKDTRPSIDISKEWERGIIPIQEIEVHNNFFIRTAYVLPKVTVCLYDTSKKVNGSYLSSYYTDLTSDYTDYYEVRPIEREVLSLNVLQKKTIHVEVYPFSSNMQKYQPYDLMLLFYDSELIGQSYQEWINYCELLTEQDIHKAEKIKLVR
ncbi:hypothetical protein KAU19_02340 [Candidatus Parcubacteria bacterium]|nr:hypothetical protein [Candidatus Parcubacteria bacterium]